MGIRDNDSTSPDLIQVRQRSGRFQTNINIDLAMSKKQSATAGSPGASVSSGAGSGITSVIGGGGDGSGGGYGPIYCFAGNTLVRMADGFEKPIRDTVLLRDVIAVPTLSGVIESGQIIHRSETMYSSWLRVHFMDGRIVEVQPSHRYRTADREFAPVVELDYVFHLNEQGRWTEVAIKEKELISGGAELDFYNFGVRHPARAYIAAGDWVSNAKPVGGNES